MPLQLDHTIVPAYDKVKSAEFIARIFGLKYEGPWGHFAPVKVNDILTLDFDNAKDPAFEPLCIPRLRRGVRLNPQTGEGRGRFVRQRPRLSDGRRDQPQAPGPRLLLRVRERPCLGSHHAHLRHGLKNHPPGCLRGRRVGNRRKVFDHLQLRRHFTRRKPGMSIPGQRICYIRARSQAGVSRRSSRGHRLENGPSPVGTDCDFPT